MSVPMKRSSGLSIVLLFVVLLSTPSRILGSSSNAQLATGIVEIAFEATAPYYEPRTLVVPANSAVRWVNPTASPHSVRHDGCLTGGPCAFESTAVLPDSSIVIGPLPPGSYGYHCELHPIMRGTLIVVATPTSEGAISVIESMR